MSITYGTPTTAIDSTGATQSLTVPAPTLADGDVLLAFISAQKGASLTQNWTLPVGFVRIVGNDTATTNEQIAAFYKVITDATAEPADYTFTHDSSGGDMCGILVPAQGVDLTTPIDAVPNPEYINTSTNAAIPFPDLTTVTNGAHYLAAAHQQRSTAITLNGDLTSLGIISSENETVGGRGTLIAGYVEVETAGAVTGQGATSNQARDSASVAFALRPATPGQGGGDPGNGGDDPGDPGDPPSGDSLVAYIWDGSVFQEADILVWDGSAWV